MKTLALATAMVAAFAATGAHAQDDSAFRASADADDLRATTLIGQAVHAPSASAEGHDERWESVGDIGDIIISRDGKVQAVLVDVGGFLGVGTREVAIRMDSLDFVEDDKTPGNPDDYLVVANLNREALEEAPEYDDQRAGAGQVAAGGPALPQPRTEAPPGFELAQQNQRTAGNLQRAEVYGPDNERIARVTDLMLDDDDRVSHILVDVGGFLGMGAHTVALPIDDVDVFWNAQDKDVRVSVPMTKNQLADMPEYDD